MGPLLIPLLSMGLQAGGEIWNQIQSSKRNKDIASLFDKEEQRINENYLSRIHGNYLDTAEAGSVISKIREQLRDSTAAMQNNAITGGATAEAVAASKEGMTDTFARTLAQLAGYGTQRKDRLISEYEGFMNNLRNKRMHLLQQQQASSMARGQNLSNTVGGILQAWGLGAFDEIKK